MNPKQLPVRIPVGIARPASVVGAEQMLQAAKDSARGIRDRIAGLNQKVVPASVVGPNPAFVLNAESQSFALDVAQSNSTTSLVNYILRSGQTYQLPVIVGGNGVFLAKKFRIVVFQKINVNLAGAVNNADAVVAPMVNAFQIFPAASIFRQINWTTKFSCFPVQPEYKQSPSINYRWNIQDQVTGYNYSDQLLPASAILNRDYVFIDGTSEDVPTPALLDDGDWHEFDTPWVFEKAYLLNILFRPLTDIIQFDSSISGTNPVIGLTYDDRINGLRNQAVSIQVEFQGERVGGR